MKRSGEDRTERKSDTPCDKDRERSPRARRTLSTSKDDETWSITSNHRNQRPSSYKETQPKIRHSQENRATSWHRLDKKQIIYATKGSKPDMELAAGCRTVTETGTEVVAESTVT